MGNIPAKPVAPLLTERNLLDQSGKVFLITGATSGIGRELAQILFAANAKVWITARSESKARQTISDINYQVANSQWALNFIVMDFNDLRTVKPAVDGFLAIENRLDVLFNNAGVMIPPDGTSTVQGYEAQLGINCLAPFLLTSLLVHLLTQSAKQTSTGSSRIVWVSSSAVKNFAPTGGIEMDNLDYRSPRNQWHKYGTSKAGNMFHAAEFGRRYASIGITSVACDPGNLDTNLYKDMGRMQHFIAKSLALKPPIFGAYTELFSGLSSEVEFDQGWAWVVPWGKVDTPRADIAQQCMQGGNATLFWDWCTEQITRYV